MSVIGSSILAGASGAAGGGSKVYVDDVFSTFLYDGTGSAQTITNGIDLSGEGGLVWIKRRSGADPHNLYDTERGVGKILRADRTNAEVTTSNGLTSFNSNGFTLGTDVDGYGSNPSGEDLVAWTFRKAPGFFDVVTYTGNGVDGTTIPHNLGSVPGMIIIKDVSATRDWAVYHRSIGATHWLKLNHTGSATDYDALFDDTEPTDSVFTVGWDTEVNNSGSTYVAYIFAHDDASFGTDGDESIIKCGTYTGNNSDSGNVITLGFEPQWLMIKSTSQSSPWLMFDNMRGIVTGSGDAYVRANDTDVEATTTSWGGVELLPTGFQIQGTSGTWMNSSGDNYIYMAIRRPNKPPEAATEVFAMDTRSGTSPTPPTYKSGFPVDWVWERAINTTNNWSARTRLTGNGKELDLNLSGAEGSNSNTRIEFDRNDGLGTDATVDSNRYAWMFKRAPGFFDVVAYTGTGSATTVTHSLEAIPELMIVKSRSITDHWQVYSSVTDETDFLMLNSTNSTDDQVSKWNDTAPTSSVFTVGTDTGVNQSSATYIAYLFATLPGISKVGSYTGTGSALNVDCGFTSGARFVLIKRTDTGGNWFVLDTARGIVGGNDPLLELNSSSAQDSSYDNLDPYNQGFTVTAYGGTSPYLNISGGTYLFLAIA